MSKPAEQLLDGSAGMINGNQLSGVEGNRLRCSGRVRVTVSKEKCPRLSRGHLYIPFAPDAKRPSLRGQV